MPDPQMRRSDAASAVSRPVAAAKSQVREYAEALGVALLLALVIRTFVVQAFKIPSGSMLPTLQIGDHLLVNKFVYGPRLEVPLTDVSLGRLPGLRKPRQGDVIVFLAPARASSDRQRRDFIKRVIAVEGQTIEVRAKQVYIDGKPWDDPHATFLSGKPDPATERPSNPLLRQCGSLESGSGHSCAVYTVPPATSSSWATTASRATTRASGVRCRSATSRVRRSSSTGRGTAPTAGCAGSGSAGW